MSALYLARNSATCLLAPDEPDQGDDGTVQGCRRLGHVNQTGSERTVNTTLS